MKNVLLFGPSGSLFIRDFCEEVLSPKYRITILTCHYSKQYEQYYEQNDIKQIEWPELFSKGIFQNLRINIVNRYASCIRDLKEKIGFDAQIDVMFIHYVEPLHIFYLFPIWKEAKRKVLVFWGDDILRATNKKLRLLPFFLRQATAIVFMIDSQCEYFQNRLGHKYDYKIRVVDFGNSVLSKIDRVNEAYDREQCKTRFGLSADKVSVHVGYNAFRGQQHIEMLQSIARWIASPFSEKWLNELEFVFHISYGKDDNFPAYMEEMKQVMDNAKMKYVFVEEYLQDDDLAMFRSTCDIFLYGQKTDARSASPLEYIYAGARFICPVWLKENYEELKLEENVLFEYTDFDDLPETFGRCLTRCFETDTISAESKKAIRDAISWESLAPKWRSLYE